MNRKPPLEIDGLVSLPDWHPGFTDTHFHSAAVANSGIAPAGLLEKLFGAGMGMIVDVAIQPEDVIVNRALSERFPRLLRTCGIHPSISDRQDWLKALEMVEREIASGDFAAVGETGLDWYRMYAPRPRQLDLFQRHLEAAVRHDLPVIVHNREADRDCLELLSRHPPARGGVMHCFSSQPEWVQRFVDVGMYISFAGNVTFRSAETLREAARLTPEDRLLLETDAPFLAPHPHRDRVNQPGMVVFTYSVVAEARGCSVEKVRDTVAANARRLFERPGFSTPREAES